MSARGQRAAHLREIDAVREILWRDWDPIGCGVPRDEYDSYIPDVLRLLRAGASGDALAVHLRTVAREAMSCTAPEDRLANAVAGLLALGLAR